MAYTKTTFVNGSAPGISAEELNKIGDGIEEAHSNIEELIEKAKIQEISEQDANITGTEYPEGLSYFQTSDGVSMGYPANLIVVQTIRTNSQYRITQYVTDNSSGVNGYWYRIYRADTGWSDFKKLATVNEQNTFTQPQIIESPDFPMKFGGNPARSIDGENHYRFDVYEDKLRIQSTDSNYEYVAGIIDFLHDGNIKMHHDFISSIRVKPERESTNAHLWFRDYASESLNRGLLFWDKSSNSMKLRSYKQDGLSSANEFTVKEDKTTSTKQIEAPDFIVDGVSLKQSVSDGKDQIRNAIIDQGGTVSDVGADSVNTFQELTDGVYSAGIKMNDTTENDNYIDPLGGVGKGDLINVSEGIVASSTHQFSTSSLNNRYVFKVNDTRMIILHNGSAELFDLNADGNLTSVTNFVWAEGRVNGFSAVQLTTTSYIVAYDNGDAGYVQKILLDGTTLRTGGAYYHQSGRTTNSQLGRLNDTYAVLTYNSTDRSSYARGKILYSATTSTSVSHYSEYSIRSSKSLYIELVTLSSSKALITYKSGGSNGDDGFAQVLSLSTSSRSVSAGSTFTFNHYMDSSSNLLKVSSSLALVGHSENSEAYISLLYVSGTSVSLVQEYKVDGTDYEKARFMLLNSGKVAAYYAKKNADATYTGTLEILEVTSTGITPLAKTTLDFDSFNGGKDWVDLGNGKHLLTHQRRDSTGCEVSIFNEVDIVTKAVRDADGNKSAKGVVKSVNGDQVTVVKF
ncbi:hypothetical protein VQL36_11530 [Chengkuizengella sp. SCS-71B]|uniref:hypothetical protein n=1 Tax=Chengkuizengella sp. SCS-71B TaxID=3115290 RepID=UPI0032C23132